MDSKNKLKLRVKGVAEYLKISVSSIDRMLANGLFVQPDFCIGPGKIRVWEQSSVDAWLETQRNPKSLP